MSNVTTLENRPGLIWSLLLAVIINGVACASVVNRVQIEAGDKPNTPIFVLSDTSGHGPAGTVYGFSVIPCGRETPVWQLVASGSNGAPARFAYGDSVPGYLTRIGPVPLSTGCYETFVTDGRRVRFHVDAAGRINVR